MSLVSGSARIGVGVAARFSGPSKVALDGLGSLYVADWSNAAIRKIFDVSSNAWLEAQWYLFGAAFLLAAAYTLKQNEHIRIDIVYGAFSRRIQHWIDLFGHVFFLMPFLVLMLWLMFPWLMMSVRSGEVSTNSGGLIIWPAKSLLLIGFGLLFLQGISEIIKKVGVMLGLIPDPHTFAGHHGAAEAFVEEEGI